MGGVGCGSFLDSLDGTGIDCQKLLPFTVVGNARLDVLVLYKAASEVTRATNYSRKVLEMALQRAHYILFKGESLHPGCPQVKSINIYESLEVNKSNVSVLVVVIVNATSALK